MPAFPLYLFDIDGTLISPGPGARRILNETIRQATGINPDLQLRDVAGYTDRTIIRNALRRCGVNGDSPSLLEDVIRQYLLLLEDHFQVSDSPFVFPDALRFMEKIEELGWSMGILTGNVQAGAKIKLGKFDLWRRFAFGVFGDEAEDRLGLGALVQDRAREILKKTFPYDDMIIVGDTEQDARLAKTYGMKSIIVCRHKEWQSAIRQAGADYVVHSLDEITPIC